MLLGEDEEIREVDLGLLHSSAAESLLGLIVSRLKQEGLLEESVSPDFLVRNWPPALTEWPTKAVRDTFFASPQIPRLLNPETLRNTIAEGVRAGRFGYASKGYQGELGQPAIGDPNFQPGMVEFSDQAVLLPRDRALELLSPPPEQRVAGGLAPPVAPPPAESQVPVPRVSSVRAYRRLAWEGELPPQQWTNFYMKVLTHFATGPSLRLHVRVEVAPEGGISQTRVEEIVAALRELGLDERGLQSD